MKLRVFQSRSGDCLLLSQETHHILIDGGFGSSYKTHVRNRLSEFVGDDGLDLLCVSHIDSDHISGLLELLDNIVDWRVFHHQNSQGNPNVQEPNFPEPPAIDAIWYNGFKDIVDETTPIEDMLIFNMRALGVSTLLRPLAEEMSHLATSVRQGLELQNRISPQQLSIPLNPDFDGGLMWIADPVDTFEIGDMEISLLGPFGEDLEALRADWNEWVENNNNAIKEVREQAEEDQELLGLDDGAALEGLLRSFALAQERGNVTVPNLASIVLLVEGDNQKFLMTGDARDNEIIEGLEANGKLDQEGRIHVDVLKVQHHGSINNVNRAFCKAVTADNYVICGGSGGNHKNPDKAVLEFIIDSRTKTGPHKSTHSKVDDPFTFWFSSNDKSGGPSANEYMATIMNFMNAKAAASNKFTVEFMPEDGDFLEVPAP